MTVLLRTPLLLAIVGLSLAASCSSNTTKNIEAFADRVCDCKDAACAQTVQTEYLEWWKSNQRARGSEGDRKDIETAMQRYSECHSDLVVPKPALPIPPVVPKVDLSLPASRPPANP